MFKLNSVAFSLIFILLYSVAFSAEKNESLLISQKVNSTSLGSDDPDTNSTVVTRTSFFLDDVFFGVGATAGMEHFMAAKIMAVKPHPLFAQKDHFGHKTDRSPPANGLYPYSFYYGGEISIMMFFAVWGGVSANVGFNIQNFTFDNSISIMAVGGIPNDGAQVHYSSYNPKIGLRIGRFWFKVGPSISLDGDGFADDWFRINNVDYNFELSFIIPSDF